MTPYDTHATADPFAYSLSAFETLIRTLSGGDASTWTHAELEEHLEKAGRDLLRLLLQDHLDLRAAREEKQVRAGAGPVVVGPEGRVRPWREPGHQRWLATVFGIVRVTRVAHRGPGACNVHPADTALSLPVGRHSTGLRWLAVTEAVRGSFDQAHDAIGRRCGNVLGTPPRSSARPNRSSPTLSTRRKPATRSTCDRGSSSSTAPATSST